MDVIDVLHNWRITILYVTHVTLLCLFKVKSTCSLRNPLFGDNGYSGFYLKCGTCVQDLKFHFNQKLATFIYTRG